MGSACCAAGTMARYALCPRGSDVQTRGGFNRTAIVIVFSASSPKYFINPIRSLLVTLCDMNLINLATTCVDCKIDSYDTTHFTIVE